MLIMTQSKDRIINFNDFSVIYWTVCNHKPCIYAAQCGNKNWEVCLGYYKTASDVYDALDLIISYGNSKNIFVMPKEDEVNKRVEIAKKEGLL